jgi:hypothetical protein
MPQPDTDGEETISLASTGSSTVPPSIREAH